MSRRSASPVEDLTREDIERGLGLLDDAIGASELLMSVAPLRFITYGGMLAVAVFGNRDSTKDVDALVEPNVHEADEYREELRGVVQDVAAAANFKLDWFNDELKLFIRRDTRQQLFFDSFQQGIIAFQGTNLVLYAGSLDFGLERKLRRLQERRGELRRTKDSLDAVALVHQLKGDSPHPLSLEYVRGLDRNRFGMPVGARAIEAVSLDYVEIYQSLGVAEMVWDDEAEKYRYRDLAGQWVWYE